MVDFGVSDIGESVSGIGHFGPGVDVLAQDKPVFKVAGPHQRLFAIGGKGVGELDRLDPETFFVLFGPDIGTLRIVEFAQVFAEEIGLFIAQLPSVGRPYTFVVKDLEAPVIFSFRFYIRPYGRRRGGHPAS